MSLEGLSTDLTVGNRLDISDNWSLESLEGLPAINFNTSATILITNTDLLVDLKGLMPIQHLSDLAIVGNDRLTNIADLVVTDDSSADSVTIAGNLELIGLEGLEWLESVIRLDILENPKLMDLTGLSALKTAQFINIFLNDALASLAGLEALEQTIDLGGPPYDLRPDYVVPPGSLLVWINDSLQTLEALTSLKLVEGILAISSNEALNDLSGIESIRSVGEISVRGNSSLSDCQELLRLVDPIDDYEPGPGPGAAGIPDVAEAVRFEENLEGCNSKSEIQAAAPLFGINAGLNDAWFNRNTDGQGFLITVFPEIEQVFLAWFTYDTERPPEDVTAILGESGHRWLTAQGEYIGNVAELTLYVTEGGEFDSDEPEPGTEPYGELLLEFSTCNAGLITYDIPSVSLQGAIPIERIVLDNVSLCYLLEYKASDSNPADESGR